MRRLTCESCGALQPKDAEPSFACHRCGAPIRRETRCPWCVEWTPEARFCRRCAAELVPPDRFGAARILKAAGVDRFSLAKRLAELDLEQVATLQSQYERQLGVVTRLVDEMALCEEHLIGRGYALALEDRLVPSLPLDETELAQLSTSIDVTGRGADELLPEIAARSPLQESRELAALALLRRGRIDEDLLAIAGALLCRPGEIALEAAAALASWRTLADPWRGRFDAADLARTATPGLELEPFAAWSAVACARPWVGPDGRDEQGRRRSAERQATPGRERVIDLLREACGSADADLSFSAALALGDEEAVGQRLSDGDDPKRELAQRFLARRWSPAVLPLLARGTDPERQRVLESLPAGDPPPPFVEPLLLAIEGGSPEVRGRATWRLRTHLDEQAVERVLAVARRERDGEMLRGLAGAPKLAQAERVLTAIIEDDLFTLPNLDQGLTELVHRGLVSSGCLVGLLARFPGEKRRRALLPLARRLLEEQSDRPLLLALVGLALSTEPAPFRAACYWAMYPAARRCPHLRVAEALKLDSATRVEIAGSDPLFTEGLARSVADPGSWREVGYYEWLADVLEDFVPTDPQEDAAAERADGELVEALIATLKNSDRLVLRTAAAKLLPRFLAGPRHRPVILEAVNALRSTDLPYDLTYWLDRLVGPSA